MLCRKRFLFIPFLCLLFSVFFSFTLEKNSFATSVSCSGSGPFTSQWNVTLPCDFSSLVSSGPTTLYFKIDISYSSAPSRDICGTSLPIVRLGYGQNDLPYVDFYTQSTYYPISSYSAISSFYYNISELPFTYFNKLSVSCYSLVSDWSLVGTDDLSTFAGGSVPSGTLSISSNGQYDVTQYEYVDVNVANEVIQGDYHDDLVSIKHAIITCGGVILVLYFFYCIYRMIIKNSGVH